MELTNEGFGYQVLPFEHEKDRDLDVGLKAYPDPNNILNTHFKILHSIQDPEARQPFVLLADYISYFFDRVSNKSNNSLHNQIVFCRECRRFQIISMKKDYECPSCKSNLIMQS